MKQLIQGAVIADPSSPHHGKKRDLLIARGRIEEVAAKITDVPKHVVREKGLHVSPGWVDMAAQFCDPGEEWKEDLHTGLDAAAAGGFTGVVAMPATHPPVSGKAAVEYALRKAQGHRTQLLVAGTLSADRNGRQLSEMADMHRAGAVAFTDYKRPVNRTELMTRALDYARGFNGLILSFPWDDGVASKGVMHEGPMSVSLGLQGLPSLSEELRLSRDLDLLRYTGGRMHVLLVSSARSVALIKAAKKEGLQVTCGVSAHHLFFSDEALSGFDTIHKVLPPYRGKADVKALRKAVLDGTIDVVCSDHSPQDIESKAREFEYADWGFASIETTYPALQTALSEKCSPGLVAERMALAPRRILGQEAPVIEAGAPANLTLFNPTGSTAVNAAKLASKSTLSPFDGHTLDGHVVDVIRG